MRQAVWTEEERGLFQPRGGVILQDNRQYARSVA